MFMKPKFLLNFLFLSVLLCFSACKSEESLPADPVTEVSSTTLSFAGAGGSQNISFDASNDWKIQSSASWLTVSKLTGAGGVTTVTITTTANTSKEERTGTLTLIVNGYNANTTLCTVTQKLPEKGVNHWMADYMSEAYLWNTEFKTVKSKLDYTIDDPDTFLESALSSMTTNKADDGYDNANGTHHYFSYIETTSSSSSNKSITTRADNGKATNFGFGMFFAAKLTTTTYALGVQYVYPGSPAETAGMKRGTIVTKYNGTKITSANLNEVFNTLMGYDDVSSVTLTTQAYVSKASEVKDTKTGKTYTYTGYYLDDKETTVSLSKVKYDANPILASKTIKPEGSNHIVGYFAYASFDLYHDKDMMNAFEQFKKDGITDLVIDLRYNGGGYVHSSAALATLVAGSAYSGQTYSQMEYNADRSANGEVGYYYIGKSPAYYDPDKKKLVTDNYEVIVNALSDAVNLKKIYVLTTDNTASASELIINGLRGLGIEVVTVGTTTIGKNVGMEVAESDDFKKDYDFEGNSYSFAPITFKSYNAKHQSDYADGFEPNCEVEETARLFDWGTYSLSAEKDVNDHYEYNEVISILKGADPLMSCAMYNIVNGTWPISTSNVVSASRAASANAYDTQFRNMVRNTNMRGSIVVKRLPKE